MPAKKKWVTARFPLSLHLKTQPQDFNHAVRQGDRAYVFEETKHTVTLQHPELKDTGLVDTSDWTVSGFMAAWE